MSVSGPSDATATSGAAAPRGPLPVDILARTITVRVDLVAHVGAQSALVLTAVTDASMRHSMSAIARATGLSEAACMAACKELVEMGILRHGDSMWLELAQ